MSENRMQELAILIPFVRQQLRELQNEEKDLVIQELISVYPNRWVVKILGENDGDPDVKEGLEAFEVCGGNGKFFRVDSLEEIGYDLVQDEVTSEWEDFGPGRAVCHGHYLLVETKAETERIFSDPEKFQRDYEGGLYG